MKNAVVAGIVALVVAVGVLLGARALSPVDNSGVSPVAVMAPDGSIIGNTTPIRASSGPPVPACVTTNTVLTCEGVGVPFGWHFPIGSGDSGIANEAFGALVPVNTDAGFTVVGKATITPDQTGEMALTASIQVPFGDAACPFEGGVSTNSGMAVVYGIHNSDAAAGTPIAANYLSCVNLAPLTAGTVVTVNVGGAVSGLVNDGGTSYDFFIMGGGGGGVNIPDSSVGGIWVHEVP
jgi:hypothetical protein